MKNIVFKVNSLNIGGIERLTIDTMNMLEEKGFNLFIILDGRNNLLEKQLSENIKKHYLNDSKTIKFCSSLISMKNKNIFYKIVAELSKIILDKSILKNVNRILNKEKIDIFIDYTGEYKRYANKIKCEKKIIWQHASILGTSKKKLKKYEKRISNYNLIVCVCEELKEEMQKLFSTLKSKIIKIYNFIDEDRIAELEENYSKVTKQDKKLLKEDYCISLGRLTEGKGYKVTINAFEELINKGYNEKLYIIGDGEYKIQLKKIISDKNLEDHIFLLGKKENPYIWLNNSKLFIHSSYKEGFGLVLVEALFCGTPVISSEYKCGVKEILENGKLGMLYEVKNHKDLSCKIEKIVSKKALNIENSMIKFHKKSVIEELINILK